MRAMHAVLDTAVFLLVVGVAVGTLMVPAPSLDDGSADAGMETLMTATAQVEYAPAADQVAQGGAESGLARTARGSLADLLASAAVRAVRINGEPVGHPDAGFEPAVIAAVENATRPGHPVAVRAVWEPYEGGPVRGVVRAGPRPPVDADVWAATATVSTAGATVRSDGGHATDGYPGVARAVAAATISTQFPPAPTRIALREGPPMDAITTARYRRFAALVDTSLDGSGANRSRRWNERLTGALAGRLERDLRSSFESPDAAARAVTVHRVRITVRVWERGQ